MSKAGKFLKCFLPLITALFCQVAMSMVVSIGYGVYLGAKMLSLGITDAAEKQSFLAQSMSADYILAVTALSTALTLAVGALWYRKHKPETDFWLKEVVNGRLIAALACLGLSLQFLISMCLNAVYPILPQDMSDQYSALMESLLGGNLWLSLFTTVILAPVAEELIFRGVTMKMAQKIMPFMAANLLQAILFGVYHLNWIQGIYAFVLGMILGFTAEYFHSVWASILLHAFVNGSAEVLSHLPNAVTETLIGNIGLAAIGVVLLFVAAKLYPTALKVLPVKENANFTENSFDE